MGIGGSGESRSISKSFGGGGGGWLEGEVWITGTAAAAMSPVGRLLGRREIVLSIRHLMKYIATINSVLSSAPRCLLSAKFLDDAQSKRGGTIHKTDHISARSFTGSFDLSNMRLLFSPVVRLVDSCECIGRTNLTEGH